MGVTDNDTGDSFEVVREGHTPMEVPYSMKGRKEHDQTVSRERLFHYDVVSGALVVHQGRFAGLEESLGAAGIPEDGLDLQLQLPNGEVSLPRVKSVRYFTPSEVIAPVVVPEHL